MIELDVLADYAAGLLDGTPQGAEVARLVATDPAWALAYADLTAADRRIARTLAGLPAEPVPHDIAARLDSVFAGVRRDGGDLDDGRRAAGSRTNVISIDDARRRRRFTRAAGIAAVAAGVVAFGVLGVNVLGVNVLSGGGMQAGTSNGATADNAAKGGGFSAEGSAPAPAAPDAGSDRAFITSIVRLSSGIDYRRETLSAAPARNGVAATGVAPPTTVEQLAKAPDELTRLVGPDALRDCVVAITAVHRGRVVSVDYARFEGSAALIARLVDPGLVVVVGPACGLPSVGTDERYRAAAN